MGNSVLTATVAKWQKTHQKSKRLLLAKQGLNSYITWYNSEKAKRPIQILRTQLDRSGNFEYIPMPSSDDEWQYPTPPPSPIILSTQTTREIESHAVLFNSEAMSEVLLDASDLELLFDDLEVTSQLHNGF